LIASQKQKLSRIVTISTTNNFEEVKVFNPFNEKLAATINSPKPQLVHLNLIDNWGRIVRSQQFTLTTGSNYLQMTNTSNLPNGLYTLQVKFISTKIISKKVIKQ